MSYADKIDEIIKEIAKDEELLSELVPSIINDSIFHRAISDIILRGDCQKLSYICDKNAYSFAINLDQKRRGI